MFRLAMGLVLFLCSLAHARGPGLQEFMRECRRHSDAQEASAFKAPKPGSISYLPTAALRSSQGRFSWASAKRKLRQALEREPDAYIDKKNNEWVLPHHKARAFYPLSKAIRGIYYRGEILIVDGHHRALISIYLGAETIPVHILEDLSRLTPARLTEYMIQNDYSYFRNYRGQRTSPVDLCAMEDDPNLELARTLIARVEVSFKRGELRYHHLRGKDRVIGIKTEEDIPYLEFEVADALRRAGIAWKDGYDDEFSKDELAGFLRILQDAAARNPNSRLRKVLLFEKPTRVADLELHDLLLAHLQDLGCEEALSNRE